MAVSSTGLVPVLGLTSPRVCVNRRTRHADLSEYDLDDGVNPVKPPPRRRPRWQAAGMSLLLVALALGMALVAMALHGAMYTTVASPDTMVMPGWAARVGEDVGRLSLTEKRV
jgi:hypothetical protein